MPEFTTDWPRKTRDLQNHHMDSTLWNDFVFRDDDVIIGTYAKSGTTWTQQIVGQLIHQGDPSIAMAELSPWWDMRVIPPEVRQEVLGFRGRRVLKTHLPADALVLSPRAKYLYVGRDGRDIAWSLHNHHLNHSDLVFALLNETPGLVGPPLPRADPDVRSYFNFWLESDGGHFPPVPIDEEGAIDFHTAGGFVLESRGVLSGQGSGPDFAVASVQQIVVETGVARRLGDEG